MKKNISININGIIFHIEEDGYDKLLKYLDSINIYFSSFADNSEILSDIESRIAEIFLSKLSDRKQVITNNDVNSLIATMGSIRDFQAAEEQEFAATDEAKQDSKEMKSTSQKKAGKKLYRDQKRKIMGGVCAGLAHYFSIDPVWPRLFFILLVLGSYGSLLLVYIILWVALPHATELEEESNVKKMLRDSEHKVVGGVASGVAAFFGADIALIRILFVITTIFGVLGLLLYIILWMVLPEAKSITEKIQMQGEPVTLSNIESSVKKGLNEEDEEESIPVKIILFPFRLIAAILNGIVKLVGPFFSVAVDILRVAFGVLLGMIGLLLFCVLVCICIFLGFLSKDGSPLWWDMGITGTSLPMEAIINTFPLWMMILGVITALIPSLFIALLGISIVTKRIGFKPIVGWSLFAVFFVCIGILSFKILHTVYSFRDEGTYKVEEKYTLDNKMLIFQVNDVDLQDYDVAKIRFIGNNENQLRIIKRFEAQGSSRKAASKNAQMVDYIVIKNDSIVTMDSNLTFKDGALFRAQRVKVDVYVPFETPFIIDEELWRAIDNYGIHYHGNYPSQNTWQMTTSGMECLSCESNSPRSEKHRDDRYGLSNFDSIELNGVSNVRIEQGDDYAVEVNRLDRQKNLYDVFLDGETLIIDYGNARS